MKVAVTSVTGKLGAAIASKLIEKIGKEHVVGIARTPENAKALNIEVRKGDYNQRDQLNESLKNIDAVILISGNEKPELRIQQHRNLILAAKECGVKKIVYTSIVGPETETAFSPVVASNRQTEEDIKSSGLDWAIGRNGIYLEPDLEYIKEYQKQGKITNCAGQGLCGYTNREELATAYADILLDKQHNEKTFNLLGHSITQETLANNINQVFGTHLSYHSMTPKAYEQDRKAALGDFMGGIIAGIYNGMLKGAYHLESDFEKATGRSHKSNLEMMHDFKNSLP